MKLAESPKVALKQLKGAALENIKSETDLLKYYCCLLSLNDQAVEPPKYFAFFGNLGVPRR
jgi:hypothetical protein